MTLERTIFHDNISRITAQAKKTENFYDNATSPQCQSFYDCFLKKTQKYIIKKLITAKICSKIIFSVF